MIELAKPALDVGLYTNNREAMLNFWQEQARVPFSELLRVGGGVHQHRHAIGDSVLKINDCRDPLTLSPACGIRRLTIAGDWETETECDDPDGNKVRLVPSDADGVEQIRVDLVVSDFAAHRHFYHHILGFPEITEDTFACGVSQLRLTEGKAHRDPAQKGPGYRYLTIQVFDVKGSHAHILSAGGREGSTPKKLGEVAHISFVRDPDGNWIEISQRKSITGSLD